jgi:hypothetical protein
MGTTPMKGQITIPERAITQKFMYNPPEIKDSKSMDFGTLKVPGTSHPVYQSGGGGDRVISFTLYLDGDRGNYVKGQPPATMSIQRQLEFYRSMVYPGDAKLADMASAFPYMILFTFGSMWNSVPCIVPEVNITVKAFDKSLNPLRADVELQLKEFPDRVITTTEIYPDYDFG